MLFSLRLTVIVILLPALVHARSGPEHWVAIGSWDISYYPETRGCLAYSAFDGTGFFIGFDTFEEVPALDITVLDPRWESIQPQNLYPVTLVFGDEAPWLLEMQGVRMDGLPGLHILIDASIEKSAELVEEFQRELRMTWSYAGENLGQFTLLGSRRAFSEVLACQEARGTGQSPLVATD